VTDDRTPDDGEPTEEIDMSKVFADEELINDLVLGLVPPDDRMARVLDTWKKTLHIGEDELGDPSVDMWKEAMQRAIERAQKQPDWVLVLTELLAGLILLFKALGLAVKLVAEAVIRLLAQLPWKEPRPWER